MVVWMTGPRRRIPRLRVAAGGIFIVSLLLLFLPRFAYGVDKVVVIALMQNKAILRVDGKQHVLAAGQTSPEGVKLISADTDVAVVEIDGHREQLPLQVVTGMGRGRGPARVTLWQGDGGFFYTDGEINGRTVHFLVDTGADSIALSTQEADRIGLDYRSGRRSIARTASGTAPMYHVKLNQVTVGDITLYDVDAAIVLGSYPETPLLGNSFLGQLEMKREGDKMELIQR